MHLARFFFNWIPIFLLINPSADAHLFRVVIDPGHGGADEGAVFQSGKYRITEKMITLKLAHQVAHQLQSKGYWVKLTRASDQEISLKQRTAIANRIQADAFISIHMNSTDGRNLTNTQGNAQGIETYILNNTTDASSRRLAHLENSMISPSDSNSPEQKDVALILKDLRLDANLLDSKRLACHIQEKLVAATSQRRAASKRDRGVKQALFHVLLGADMPSVLVEAGFLNNTQDRIFVLSARGQLLISHSITQAVDDFRNQKETRQKSVTWNKCKVH